MYSLSSFVNGDFETGDSTGWTVGGGGRSGINSYSLKPQDYLYDHQLCRQKTALNRSSIVTSDNDTLVGNLMENIVHRGNFSWRIEDTTNESCLSVISQQINNYFCPSIYFAWLAVLGNGGHTEEDSAVVIVNLKDTTSGENLINLVYNAGKNDAGDNNRFERFGNYFYTPSWQEEYLNISSDSIGHNFTLSILAADCKLRGHTGYVYLDSFGCDMP